MGSGLILGIESSCDETAAAVVRSGHDILSNVVSSQVAMHALYGGVVPELASREHLRNVVPVVREAIRSAGITYADLDAVAVTSGPGLAGALLVGISFAKSLSFGLGKPLLAINHLEGHIHAALLQSSTQVDEATTTEPTLALVVSGGHTHLYLASQTSGAWHYRNIGRTVDDAAGEAYDKVAKLLGLPYPGGPWMDRLSAFGNPEAVRFTFSTIDRGTPGEPTFDFSFSGIKTAVLRYLETHSLREASATRHTALSAIASPTLEDARALCDPQTLDLIASFQHAVVSNLVRQTLRAAEHTGARSLVISGGVASNRALRARFTEVAQQRGLTVAFPPPALSTDNAAMIAAAAWPRFLHADFAPATLNATPQLRLG
ncbi:tRNA (adenosine(37)-N6)-threonylcarbamoyltransferase complex transferase subunit TsaD [Terriglobus aquaticus]|uniref:tRNA N6-adenosine threonylcarbamoyltransferase n=1 Tax=Terriglobus aquaticus TaxID=940139 RepID=A0ABW9KGL8_9BACT|nr:tRNA (adenosine(37)-N6)-threonylcarbamoyltransferase complex transferase subunit TsaD [Terriglobus aquaticus]